MSRYEPTLPPERIEELWRWHEDASAELHARGDVDVEYSGLRLHVPATVFGPTPTSDLLGQEVRRYVRPGHRVLDMGCGAGANALLAAQITDQVLAVDINPDAVAATAANAEANGLAERVVCRESDVFSAVDGDFDVIVIDRPFRWFAARDVLELAFVGRPRRQAESPGTSSRSWGNRIGDTDESVPPSDRHRPAI